VTLSIPPTQGLAEQRQDPQILLPAGGLLGPHHVGQVGEGSVDSTQADHPGSPGEVVSDANSVATQESGQAVVATALEHFGRVDILVNNAGVLRDQTFHKAGPEDVSMVLDVHVGGAFWVGSAAFRQMREQRYGRVVDTSSAAGLFGNFGQASYATAKMGLVGLTRVMAIEGARCGIKANVIAPDARTRMTEELLGPLADRFLPEHVAPVVAYLAHESCTVTGNIFAAAAGRVAKIFVAETSGIFEADLTPEDVRDRFREICDEVGYVVPASVEDEQALIVTHL
jgi:NAD(P)-dependent dehydrogenase (short-subunit alcohol dehydrogenase family)